MAATAVTPLSGVGESGAAAQVPVPPGGADDLSRVLAAAVGNVTAAADAASAPRPNIVFMITDDQRWDALGFVQRAQSAGRFPFFKSYTPNIDRLASEGVWFSNAFVTDSLCSPSRAAMLTGKYPHMTGVLDNRTEFPVNSDTWVERLHRAGYRTGYFGKWHMNAQTARPGFDRYASYVGQGDYYNTPFIVNGVNTPSTGWVDDVATDYAVNFILYSARLNWPFVAILGFKSPHGPLVDASPERYKNLFSDVQIDHPANATAVPPYFPDSKPSWLSSANLREYFRVLAGMDDNVGRVLAALDYRQITNDTVVVFISDNGFHMVEHGSPRSNPTDGEKRSAYEASIHVPLILRYPRAVQPGTIPARVLNIDLAPTFLKMAGLVPPATMQGMDLSPLLDRSATTLREGIFYEYFYEWGFVVPTMKAYRDVRYKLIEYPDNPEYGKELYDLVADPWETTNIASQPAMQIKVDELQTKLDQSAASYSYPGTTTTSGR